jgi:hypothetical protein
MPILALLYCLLLSFLGVAAILDPPKERDPLWFTALNVASVLILILAFIGYWEKGLIQSLGVFAPLLFLFSLIWEACTCGHALEADIVRRFPADPPNLRPFIRRFCTGAEVLLVLPGFWFGGLAVLRAL